MNSNSGEGKVVCVTGASGYIASWLVKLLLERGYTVRGTVRDLNDPKKTEHLQALPGAKERLILFEANLEEEGTFDSVIDGCQGVFHTASPCFFTATDPQAQLIEPAVKGTLNVLGSCAKTPSVKRVVVTSSFAAVAYNGTPRTPEVIIDETWFSDPDICRETKSWYQLSKTLAEAAAWKFAKENGLDIIVMNPGAAIGPLVQPTLNSTSALILKLINGSETIPNMTFEWVHVRDVANAHILGFEIPSASGRYCLVDRILRISDITKILHDLFPCLRRTQKCADDEPFVPTYQVSTEKAKGLGIDFIPLELGLKEMVQSLKEKNFINF